LPGPVYQSAWAVSAITLLVHRLKAI
jgi:hypothetical protein